MRTWNQPSARHCPPWLITSRLSSVIYSSVGFWSIVMVGLFRTLKGKSAMNENYSPPPPGLRPGARVWCYLRDSGGMMQAESTVQQESEIRSYCSRNNLTLVRVFCDVARSGGSTVKRDEFVRMIDESESEATRPDALLIWNYARFSRNENDSKLYRALLRKRGIVFHSLTDPIPHDDFEQVIEALLDFSNAEKRRQTSRDVKRGLKELVSRCDTSAPGRHLEGLAPGTPPRGYKSIPVEIGVRRNGTPHYVGKWVIDPDLSDYVKMAWELRAAGKSYQEITQATKGKVYITSASWVSFFKNKSYLGVYGKGPREIPDHHEPLITFEVWEAVQRIHESHPLYGGKGLHNPRRVGNPTLLSGFAYCLDCGAMMTHSPGNAKRAWRHYLCGKKNRQGYQACNSRRVGADKADAKIIETLMTRIFTAEYLAEALDLARQRLESTPDIERELNAERRRVEDLDIAIQRLLRTIERTDSPSALERLQQREAERTQARANVKKLSVQLTAAKVEITPEAMVIILDAWREQFNKLQETGNIREIKTYMMQFIKRVDLGYNHAKIYYTYPMIDTDNRFSNCDVLGAQEESP